MSCPEPGIGNEAARVHHASRRRGGRVAARGAHTMEIQFRRGGAMKMGRMCMRIVIALALGVISLLAIPTSLEAQRGAGISRVGWLEVCGPGPRRPHFDIFRARLAEHGYVEGKNLIIEQRFADCRYDRMPGLATDLVQVPVDVLFTMGTRAARIVDEKM